MAINYLYDKSQAGRLECALCIKWSHCDDIMLVRPSIRMFVFRSYSLVYIAHVQSQCHNSEQQKTFGILGTVLFWSRSCFEHGSKVLMCSLSPSTVYQFRPELLSIHLVIYSVRNFCQTLCNDWRFQLQRSYFRRATTSLRCIPFMYALTCTLLCDLFNDPVSCSGCVISSGEIIR